MKEGIIMAVSNVISNTSEIKKRKLKGENLILHLENGFTVVVSLLDWNRNLLQARILIIK